MNAHNTLDRQSEVGALATVTTEELPGYAEWLAELEAEQEPDWAANLD
jgi:hypothetical protein